MRLVHVPVYSVEALGKDEAVEEAREGEDDIIVARARYHDEMPSFRPDGTRLPPNPPPPGSNKACLEPYRQASMAIFRLLKDWCAQAASSTILEKGGLDEAFLDITEAVEEELVDEFAEKYTILRDDVAEEVISEENIIDYDLEYLNTTLQNWDALGEQVKIFNSSTETSPLETLQMKLGELRIWKGCQLAKSLRARLRTELNFIASIGVGPNKMLAKLISALHKPDKQTRILPTQIESFMRTVPFEKIRLMGGKMGQRVLERGGEEEELDDADEEDDTETIQSNQDEVMASDLWPLSVAELGERVGDRQTAAWIYNLIRGRDDSPCTPRSLTKSFMSAKSFRPFIKDWPELHDWCIVLCGELWSRLQEERELSSRWPATLTIHFRAFSNKQQQPQQLKRQWSNSGAQSKSSEFPKSSHPDPLVVKLTDVLNSVFKLLKATEGLFPMSRLAVSVHNFKPLDAQGRAKLTRVDQFFAPSAANSSFDLPPSKASLFEESDKKPEQQSVKKPILPEKSKSVLELLQKAARVDDTLANSAEKDPQINSKKSSIGAFFKYKCPKCKFTCERDNEPVIQEHSDYHLALELSRT